MPDDPVVEQLLADLPALPAEISDADAVAWEARVLASIQARADEPEPSGTQMFLARRRWLVWVGAAAMVAAVLLYLVLHHGGHAPVVAGGGSVGLVAVRGPERHRTDNPAVGDTLLAEAIGGELRLYDRDGVELARCAVGTEPHCTVIGERREINLVAESTGEYQSVQFQPALGGPAVPRADAMTAAHAAKLAIDYHAVTVR
ncbi:MAG TPA: hypothetical protein VGM88_20150 [Kofleriaceae bacterium]|jgi:hypothetical protein